MKDKHFSCLEKMYLAAPINDFYQSTISVAESECEISICLNDKFFHAAGAAHGSVYFHLLDSAAFFAASSLEREFWIVTTTFTSYLTRPASQGNMRAVGRVVNMNKSQFIVEAIAFNNDDKEVARGNGIFVRTKSLLQDMPGYAK